MNYTSTVQLSALSLSLGESCFLRDVDLSISDGEYFVLLGASGCGKTSILRAIAGLLNPQDGRILLNGQDVVSSAPRQRPISLMPQSEGVYPHLSVSRSIAAGIRERMTADEKRRRVRDVAASLGIERLLDRTPDQLSGGQLRRASLAKTLVAGAGIRLLDEPLSAIDTHLRFELERDLSRLHRECGGITLHVTHDWGEASRLGDRIAVIEGGTVAQVEAPEEIEQFPSTLGIASLATTRPLDVRRVRRVSKGWQCLETDGELLSGPSAPDGTIACVVVRNDGTDPALDRQNVQWFSAEEPFLALQPTT
ncbi:MAG: ABC transporter ATP-binding protein [Planctomycetota bacterium]